MPKEWYAPEWGGGDPYTRKKPYYSSDPILDVINTANDLFDKIDEIKDLIDDIEDMIEDMIEED